MTEENNANIFDFLKLDITDELKDQLTRLNTLMVPWQRLWERVLKDPANKESYLFTDDEVLLIKHTAESYLSGDRSGK